MANDISRAGRARRRASCPMRLPELVGKAKELAGATGGQAVVGLLLGASGPGRRDHRRPTPCSPSTTPRSTTTRPRPGRRRCGALARAPAPPGAHRQLHRSGWTSAPALSAALEGPAGRLHRRPRSRRRATSSPRPRSIGGKLLAEVALDRRHGVCTVVAGSFPAAGAGAGSPAVEASRLPPGSTTSRRRSCTMVEPEGGDVDITAADLLVSVGRGIGSQDNMERRAGAGRRAGRRRCRPRGRSPTAGWLPKTRQVGKSGLQGQAQGVPRPSASPARPSTSRACATPS